MYLAIFAFLASFDIVIQCLIKMRYIFFFESNFQRIYFLKGILSKSYLKQYRKRNHFFHLSQDTPEINPLFLLYLRPSETSFLFIIAVINSNTPI